MANFTPVGVELVVKGADNFNKTLGGASKSIAGFGKAAVKTAALGAAAVGAAAVGIGAASVKAAVSFESAFAGVIKTTDGLVDEMGNLTDAGEEVQQGFRDLSKEVPTAVEELLAIGELGGQLGIAQDRLIDFTKTIAAMGEATNLTTEEAATGFAQIANIMGTPQEQIANMGSSIVALGNNFATTERDVLSFAQRIAGAGQIANVSEADIFGISAAFSSVGIQAEAGGTAVQKVLLAMNQSVLEGGDDLKTFSKAAGLSAKEFGNLWEEDAGDAFLTFVEGLGDAGDDALGILSELGLEDQRLTRAFLSLAGAGDLLNDSLIESRVAFRDNTALAKEAAQRYATTESQFKIFKNTIKDVGITIGQFLLPIANDLLQFGLKIIPVISGIVQSLIHLVQFGEGMGPEEFIPGFLELPDRVQEIVRKVMLFLQDIVWFLKVNIPIAAGIAAEVWQTILQPALTTFIEFVTGTVIPAIGMIATWLGENLPIAIQMLSDIWTDTLLPALETFSDFVDDTIIPAVEKIMEWLGDNLQNVLIATGVVVGAVFAAWAISAAAAAAATIIALAPIIIAVAAVGAAVFTLKTAWDQNLGGVQEKTQAVIGALTNFFNSVLKPAIDEVVSFATAMFGKLVSWVEANWPLIQEAISDVMGTIQTIVETVVTAIQDFWTAHGEQILSAVSDIWDAIKFAIDQAMNLILGIIQTILLIISGDWKQAWENIKAAFENVVTAIITWLQDTAAPWLARTMQNAMEKLVEIVKGIGSALFNAGKAIIEQLRAGLAAKLGEVKDWFGKQLQGIVDMLPFSEPRDTTSPLFGLSKAGAGIVNNIQQGMEAAFPALFESFKNNLDQLFKIASGFSGFGGFIAKTFEEQTVNPIKDRIDEIGEELAGLSKIDELPGGAKGLEPLLADVFRRSPEEAREMLIEMGLDPFQLRAALGILKGFVAGDKERRDLANERARLGWELVEQEKKLLELQQKQQQLKFLQEQFKLLELIRQFDLKPEDILGGITLGLGANIDDLLSAMTMALDAVIAKANEQLGPVTAPTATNSTSAGSTTAVTVNVNAGGNTITNPTEGAMFEERVRRAVTAGIRGYV